MGYMGSDEKGRPVWRDYDYQAPEDPDEFSERPTNFTPPSTSSTATAGRSESQLGVVGDRSTIGGSPAAFSGGNWWVLGSDGLYHPGPSAPAPAAPAAPAAPPATGMGPVRTGSASVSYGPPGGATPGAPTPGAPTPGVPFSSWSQYGGPVIAPSLVNPGQTPAGGYTPPGAPTTGQTTGKRVVALPNGSAFTIPEGVSDEDAAQFEAGLAEWAAAEQQAREFTQGLQQDQFNLQEGIAAAQQAYQDALLEFRDRELAQQAAYQAMQAEFERQRLELMRAQQAQTVSLEREKMDIQRRGLRPRRMASVRFV